MAKRPIVVLKDEEVSRHEQEIELASQYDNSGDLLNLLRQNHDARLKAIDGAWDVGASSVARRLGGGRTGS